jgi:hypothetical protein
VREQNGRAYWAADLPHVEPTRDTWTERVLQVDEGGLLPGIDADGVEPSSLELAQGWASEWTVLVPRRIGCPETARLIRQSRAHEQTPAGP